VLYTGMMLDESNPGEKESINKDESSVKSKPKVAKYFLYVLVPVITFFLGMIYSQYSGSKLFFNEYLGKEQQTSVVTVSSAVPEPQEREDCSIYGPLLISQFLEEYVVKPGDTLLSVAEDELGDVSRASEIVALNQRLDRYPERSLSNPFIEQGWKLFMPPENVKQTSGNIQAYAGEIEEIGDTEFVIGFKGGGGGKVNINADTKFLLKSRKDYQIGDCLFQIEDVRREGVRALFVLPLTEEALLGFKTYVETD